MKILNFKILRQTILLLLLLLVSSFEVSVAEVEICSSTSRVKSVELWEKRTSKLLLVKEMNNSTQVVLSHVIDPIPELYMFTLPAPARPKGDKKMVAGGQFLLYDPHTERFICRQFTRNRKQKRNFVTEEYPNLKRCSFTESIDPAVTGFVQYRVGKNNFLFHKRNYYLRKNTSCSCPKVKFHRNMMALKKKKKGRRHQHLHKVLDGFTVSPNDRERCNEWQWEQRMRD